MMLQRVSRWIPLLPYWIKIGGIRFDLQCNNYNERWNAKAHVSCVGVCFELSKNIVIALLHLMSFIAIYVFEAARRVMTFTAQSFPEVLLHLQSLQQKIRIHCL